MAFIEITDPGRREEIVEDYINTKNQIKQKYENEKTIGLQQRIDLEKQYSASSNLFSFVHVLVKFTNSRKMIDLFLYLEHVNKFCATL